MLAIPRDMPQWAEYEWHSLDPVVIRHAITPGAPEWRWPYPPGVQVHHLVQFSFVETEDQALEAWKIFQKHLPHHRLTFLVNEEKFARTLKALGLPAVFASQGCLVDDRKLVIEPIQKDWNAIYATRLNPLKRIELASEVPNCHIVGKAHPEWDPPNYERELKKRYPHLKFEGGVDFKEIPRILSRSDVGLILSAAEGASRITVEYQLCGLPVVSTRAKGGRLEFLHPELSRVVPTDPQSVQKAVKDLRVQKLDPYEIRAHILRVLRNHRYRYAEVVQDIWDKTQIGKDFGRIWFPKISGFQFRPIDKLYYFAAQDVPWQEDLIPENLRYRELRSEKK